MSSSALTSWDGLDKLTGGDINADLVDGVTFGLLILVVVLSVYVNFFRRRRLRG
ncbi:hypothetical protein JCM15548_13611 [Geofilum rubicundum JCM 15548]|uniref:Uncharacterized protein n=1 Tax=Geofilum rubicundum JCM 15548 TaxID=1236989 RepID=A0A0E9M134_9BACT|nr:hypothetical protein JCM15548_13611 [Geofilum rubicundum JCM 15548]